MRSEVRTCLVCLLAAASALAAPLRATAEPIAGWWRGHAVFRGVSLELGVHFQASGAKLEARLDCPDMTILE